MDCPFCKEDDFDETGLKMHLLGVCEVFANTPLPHCHKAKYDAEGRLLDECALCGKDLRDSLHLDPWG
jgi:hypothetical protein